MPLTLPRPARVGVLLLALVAAFAIAYLVGHGGSSSAATPIQSLKLTPSTAKAIPSVSTPASLPTMHNRPAPPKTTTSSGGGTTTSSPTPAPTPTPTSPSTGGGGGGGGGGSGGGSPIISG